MMERNVSCIFQRWEDTTLFGINSDFDWFLTGCLSTSLSVSTCLVECLRMPDSVCMLLQRVRAGQCCRGHAGRVPLARIVQIGTVRCSWLLLQRVRAGKCCRRHAGRVPLARRVHPQRVPLRAHQLLGQVKHRQALAHHQGHTGPFRCLYLNACEIAWFLYYTL